MESMSELFVNEKSTSLLHSQKLPSQDSLVELSIVAGNDFTGPHVNGRLRGKFGLRSNQFEDVASWVRTYQNVENHPILGEEMVSLQVTI